MTASAGSRSLIQTIMFCFLGDLGSPAGQRFEPKQKRRAEARRFSCTCNVLLQSAMFEQRSNLWRSAVELLEEHFRILRASA
jgi:hypothetical protein